MPRVNVRKGDSWFSISKRLYGTENFAEIIRNQASNQGITKLERGQSFGLQIDTKRLKGGGKQFLKLLEKSGGSATGVPAAPDETPAESDIPADIKRIGPAGPQVPDDIKRIGTTGPQIPDDIKRIGGPIEEPETPESFPERLLRGAEDLSTGIAGAIGGGIRSAFGEPTAPPPSPTTTGGPLEGGRQTTPPPQPAPTQPFVPNTQDIQSLLGSRDAGGQLIQDPAAVEATIDFIISNYDRGEPTPILNNVVMEYLTFQDPELPAELVRKGYVFNPSNGTYVYDPTFDLGRQATNFDFRGAAGGVTGRRSGRGSRSRGRAGSSKSFVPSLGGLVNWRINFGS